MNIIELRRPGTGVWFPLEYSLPESPNLSEYMRKSEVEASYVLRAEIESTYVPRSEIEASFASLLDVIDGGTSNV